MIEPDNQSNSSSSPFGPGSEMLDAANRAFHDSYRHIVQQMQDKLGTQGYPVILIKADLATLNFNSKRYEAHILPEMYHNIKAESHLPFGPYLTLAANGSGSLTSETVMAMSGID